MQNPNACVKHLGNSTCEYNEEECVIAKGIYCPHYDPVEEEE